MSNARFKGVGLRLLVAAIGVPAIIWMMMGSREGSFWYLFCALTVSGGSSELLGFALADKSSWRAPGLRRGLSLALYFILCLWAALPIVLYGSRWVESSWAFWSVRALPRLVCEVGTGMAVLVLLLGLIWPSRVTGRWVKLFVLLLGPFYVGGLMGMLVVLRAHGTLSEGMGLCLFTFATAWVSDGAAYFGGKFFGGMKLYPRVSEGKTWSGAISGLIVAVIVCSLIKGIYLPRMTVDQCVILSVIASAFGQIGDLCESALKRAVGVKDSGQIIPGHGGVLDRFDALLFATFVIYLALRVGWLDFPFHPI